MWAAALSRSGKRCTRVSRGDARGGHACGSRRSRQVSRPRRASRASHAPVSARVVVLTVAGGSTGLVVYCTTHLPQGRPGKAPQLHKASLLHLDVDRSNGCRTRGECWAAAGCVERTDRVQLQRPPSICMLMHARARTKTGEIHLSPSFWYTTAHGTFFLSFSLKCDIFW